jgi:translation initiation factor 3 subunit C
MSRFFRKGGDSSDSSSEESEEELLSNDSGDEQKPAKPAAASGSAKPMSRFLRTEGDDSESSSEDDDEDSDESDEADEAAEKPQKKTSRFLVGAGGDDDESEDEVKRVVKSAKDKRLDEMEVSSKVIDNAVKINDWVAINNGMIGPDSNLCRLWQLMIVLLEFDKLTRAVQRLTNIAEQVPSIYIRVLSGLEASLNTALAKEKDAKKKMDATKARALNGMKQKIKKITKEYEEQVKAFQVDPVAFEASYQASVAPEVQVIAPKKIRRAVDDDGAATGAPVAEDFTTVGRGGKLYNFASDSLYKNLQLIQEARGKKVRYSSLPG